MRLGLIGRADSRGIAYQTAEFARHMDVARTLVVRMNDPNWPDEPGRFAGEVLAVDSNLSRNLDRRGLDEDACRRFLDGLDVVFAVETLYDWRFADWAREMGVRTVVQGNPEFYAHHSNPHWSWPDEWTWPTDWLVDLLPAGEILPVPVVERDVVAPSPDSERLHVLHVVGKQAAGDRNGTLEFIEAVASIRQKVKVTIVTQESRLPRRPKTPRNVELVVRAGGVKDRWEMYADQHVLVLPRKYGGLCLPVLEAMACGAVALMPDCSPNEMWPGPRVPARKGRIQISPFGKIQTFGTHPIDIARAIDRLAQHRDQLAQQMDAAQQWAQWNSWAELAPRLYTPYLEGVAAT